jgi:hypothetical protein
MRQCKGRLVGGHIGVCCQHYLHAFGSHESVQFAAFPPGRRTWGAIEESPVRAAAAPPMNVRYRMQHFDRSILNQMLVINSRYHKSAQHFERKTAVERLV